MFIGHGITVQTQRSVAILLDQVQTRRSLEVESNRVPNRQRWRTEASAAISATDDVGRTATTTDQHWSRPLGELGRRVARIALDKQDHDNVKSVSPTSTTIAPILRRN